MSQTVLTEPGEFISFILGEEEFCVDIMAVREIRGWTKPTPVPHSPGHICGVINLRGTVIPVVDFAARLGRGQLEARDSNVTIIMQVRDRLLGIVVEAVCDIITLTPDQVQKTPDVGSEALHALFPGIATVDARMVRIVNIDCLLDQSMQSIAA